MRLGLVLLLVLAGAVGAQPSGSAAAPLPDLLGDEATDGTPAGLSAPPPAETEATPEQLDQLTKLQREAERDRTAAERLAEIYLDGRWVARDLKAALTHLRKAVQLGSRTAPNKLGVLLANGGPGLPRDTIEGLHFIQMGADAKDPKAMFNLAQQYRSGELVERDEREAVKRFRECAELRDVQDPQDRAAVANAQTNLGIMLMDGLGAPRDAIGAVDLWLKAAAAENVRAWYFLGLAYARGEGVLQDPVEARRWLQKAFDKGFSPAAAAISSLEHK